MSFTSTGIAKNPYSLGCVDYLAVTENKEKTIIFRWDIPKARNFFRKSNRTLSSPVFVQSVGDNNYEWQLMIQQSKATPQEDQFAEECEFLSVYLCFKKGKSPTIVALEIGITDNLEEVVKKVYETSTTFTATGSLCGCHTFEKMSVLLDPKYHFLDGDILKLYCKLSIELPALHKMICGGEVEAENKRMPRNDDLFWDFENLFSSPLFTDVTIQTQSKTIQAHKGILSCRSSVFKAMFLNEMFESINGTVKIPDFEEDIVHGMLQYIYSGSIDAETLEDKAFEFLQIAEKYDVKGLKEEAEDVITANLSEENVAASLYLADMYNAAHLKAKAIRFFNINKAKVITTVGFKKMATEHQSLFVDLYLQRNVF